MLNIIRLAGLAAEQHKLINKFRKSRKAGMVEEQPVYAILIAAVIFAAIAFIIYLAVHAPTIFPET